MKLKKISLMTLTALYAASAGAVASSATDNKNMRSIEITDATIKLNEAIRKGEPRNKMALPATANNQTNNHRSIAATKNTKVPFKFEAGLTGEQTYIIELSDKPVSLYRGDIPQYQATSPAMSTVPAMLNARSYNKLDTNSASVKNYRQYLTSKQDEILAQIPGAMSANTNMVKGRYSLAFNGMSMRMTQEQAAQVATLPGVRNVSLEQNYQLHTDVGPKHIGAEGIWTGTTADDKYKGEGMVVGVLDTGINSDHPSFAEVAGDGYEFSRPSRYPYYLGDCEKDEFAAMCNGKLIGVRSYDVITDSYDDPVFQPDYFGWDRPFKRPPNGEDYNGHGSHTAATAAGNELYNVEHVVGELATSSDGIPTGLVFDHVSGVAPRAHIIMYQVCFPGNGSYGEPQAYQGCPGTALLSALEDAISDGVDVINYSIGTTFGNFPWDDPMEMGFLAAREAGISVSASAGNAYDPAYASQARGAIDHFSPWVTSVAATTHGRLIVVEGKKLTASTGGDAPLAEITGHGISDGYTGPVVKAADYGWEYGRCNEPFPANFFDNDPEGNPFATAPIVVCERGDIARVLKAVNIQQGGAGGLILYNSNSAETLDNDPYVIPGIHISSGDYWGDFNNGWSGLNTWLSSGSDHTITITASTVTTEAREADYVADFSSRGPNLEAPDVMSPNLAAPGVDVFAAWADDMPFTMYGTPADYAAISGTSMAAPHVAGAMALLAQAHPDWTPAQIQSALMTTASLDGVNRTNDGYNSDPVPAGYADAGSGVINVSRANNAPLLLDETGENYRAANPKAGGNIHTLNLPYFYNDNCAGTCSWMRVVTATQDGSWDVSSMVSPMEGAPMLELEVSPKTFSLKAGESQVISLTAKVLEVEAIGADASQLQVTGSVILTPTNNTQPMQHLPVGVRYSADTLPSIVASTIHRQQGHTLTPPLNTAEIQSLNTKVFGLTKAERFELALKRAEIDLGQGLPTEELEADGGSKVFFFDVPEGAKRVIWEVISADPQAYTAIHLGMDLNNDSTIQWNDEALCYSISDNGDYCAVNDPVPGRYWAVAGNWKYDFEDPDNKADAIDMALTIVTDNDESNLVIEGPDSTDGMTPYQLRLNYDLPDAMAGDVYHGVVSVGSDSYNSDNLGDFAVKFHHIGSDTNISASKQTVKAGEIIDFDIELAPNLLGGEREFSLQANFPAGLQLIEDSIKVGGMGDYAQGLVIDGQTITINGTQTSSADIKREYIYTTNLSDATCKVPYGDDDAFFDIPAAGYSHLGHSGNSNEIYAIPRAANGLPHVPLYGNPEMYASDYFSISPFGYVQFDDLPDFWNVHLRIDDNFQGFPDTLVAPLWRGDVRMPESSFDWGQVKDINAVYAIVTDDHYVVQWDGGEEWFNGWAGNDNPDANAKFNIQTIIANKLNFAEGQPEIIFAYKTLQTANDHIGSIGIHGYFGERGGFGPYNGWSNDGFAFNDVNEKVSEGMVICADYRGPEQTKLNLTLSARISANAVGADNTITVNSQFADSEMITESLTISAPSHIMVAAIADQTINENTELTGLQVFYTDTKNTVNGIEISVDKNIDASISGNESGSNLTLTPKKNWYGTTEVTVTVYDMAYPDDKSSTSFMLTVNSDGKTPGVLPADPVEDDTTTESSGGSLGFLALSLLSLLAASRRRVSK